MATETLDDATATSIFRRRTLKGKLLAALQAEREERGEESIRGSVMNAAELREAFAEMGDDVPSKALFPLVQQADPDGEGVITLENFLAVVQVRRTQIDQERAQKQLVDAYVALGGDADRDAKIKSDILQAVASDFVGAAATDRAMKGVVKHKMKAVQEILDMGGALDDEEMEELKDTKELEFDQLEAFAAALNQGGADEVIDDDDDGGDGSEEGGGAADQSGKTRRSSKDMLHG